MNDQQGSKAAGKIYSPTALVLAAGLALACWGSAALADKYADDFGRLNTKLDARTANSTKGVDKTPTANEPIPGVDIIVKKNPPGHSIAVSAPTGLDGTYKLNGLEPGNYDLSIAGQRVQTITVGANKTISGVLSRQPDGTASITFNGRVGVVPGGPTSIINAPRSNIIKPTNKYADDFKQLNTKLEGRIEKPDDTQKPGISDQGASGGLSSYGTAPPKGDGILPCVDDCNSALQDVSTTRGTAPRPPKDGGKTPPIIHIQASQDEMPAGLAVTPISGIPVGLEGDPGSIRVSTKTGEDGTFHFTNLPEGKYKLTLPDQSARSVSVDADGIAGGNVMRGSDGRMSIFDRRGNLVAAPKAGEEKSGIDGQKSDDNPVGKFGNGMNAGSGMNPDIGAAGMSPPGAGPAMGGPGIGTGGYRP